ncbi:hypothetical protein DENSPDRAFT_872674 [Dentipellis sp. KUC8613]|nr:hypothetical protein DENSPDRAFT_872674 [Dentipellis sp. KUC8613]
MSTTTDALESASTFWPAILRSRLPAPKNSATQISTELQFLDNEATSVREMLRSLYSYRNSMAPISRLPPEILLLIFKLLRAADPPHLRFQGKEVFMPGWTVATHVCHDWRLLCLDAVCLWTDIRRCLRGPWADRFLSLSRTSSLTLERRYAAGDADILRRTAFRIQHLTLSVAFGRTFRDSIVHDLDRQFPRMQSLVLAVDLWPEGPRPLDSLRMNPAFELPQELLRTGCPRLRRLSLRGCILPWTAPLLARLTHFELSLRDTLAGGHPPQGPNARIPPPGYTRPELLCCLEKMALLESLVLNECIPERTDRDMWSYVAPSTVRLPLLRRLVLSGAPAQLSALLDALELPVLATLHVSSYIHPDGSEAQVHSILVPMARLLRVSSNTGTLHALQITHGFSPNRALILTGMYAEDASFHTLCTTPEPDLKLELRHHPHAAPAPAPPSALPWLQAFFKLLDLDAVRVLALAERQECPSASGFWTPEACVRLFSRTPRVEQAKAGGAAAIALLEALAANVDAPRTLLPRLATLSAANMLFLPPENARGAAFCAGLRAWLCARKHAGAPLRVVMARCGVEVDRCVEGAEGEVVDVAFQVIPPEREREKVYFEFGVRAGRPREVYVRVR